MQTRFNTLVIALLLCASLPAALPAEDLAGERDEGSRLFDGAAELKAKAAETGATRPDKEALKAEFEKHVIFDDHGVPKARAAYNALMSRLMDSPTGRDEAEKFIKADYTVKFSFAEFPGTTFGTKDGKPTFWGQSGRTSPAKRPPEVVLNSAFENSDLDFGVGTFAHETFGHAVTGMELDGENGGDRKRINNYHESDEENAHLIGWEVRSELKVPPEAEVWAYLNNPEEYRQQQHLATPTYALRLIGDELKDPVAVYKSRLADTESALSALSKDNETMAKWERIVAHFITAHKMDPESFRKIQEDIASMKTRAPGDRDVLEAVKKTYVDALAYLSSEEGKPMLETFKREAADPYFAKKQEEINSREEKLSGLLAGRSKDSAAPPPQAGLISWPQLQELWKQDKTTCSFGGIK